VERRAYLTLLLTALAGCVASEGYDMEYENLGDAGGFDVLRTIDREAGMVIYLSGGVYAGGMACVPIEETDLE